MTLISAKKMKGKGLQPGKPFGKGRKPKKPIKGRKPIK